MLVVVSSISFYWHIVQPIRLTGAREKSVPHPWQRPIAVALCAGLLISLSLISIHAQSYPTQYVATVWQTEQGLPVNSVGAIVQDGAGYLWVATDGGLARFDGVRFRVFGGEDFPSLISSRFQSLYVSRSGELWIGTRNGGLIRMHDGIITTYLERDGLPSRNVRSIREDAEGKLWINTASSVAYYADGKIQAYNTYRGKAVSEFFLQARDGSMWFRSGADVVRFGADGSGAAVPGGFMVQEARDGSVWIAFQNQSRLVRYHQGVFSDIPLSTTGVHQWAAADRWQGVARTGNPRQAVLAMATDTDGELLLLTPAGLVRAVDGKLGPTEVLPLPANISDLPKVLSLMVDREGNRWVGTVGRGLFRFRRTPLTAYGKDEGLSDSPFRAVFQDRDGYIWLGGDDGLYRFDGHQFHRVPGLAEIGAIAQTRDGDLWFGGSGAVYRWRSGVLTRFRIESPAVFQILQDREGTLWVVAPTYEQMWRFYRFREGKFDQTDADVVHMAEDQGGGLWLGGVNPPTLRFLRDGKTILYDQSRGVPSTGMHSILQDRSGAIWFCTTTGLYRLRDGRFGAISAKNGLSTELTSILDDGKGNLWLPSERGILRLSLKEANDVADGKVSSIAPISYGIAEGMKSSECNGGVPGACKARDGRLWFPTMRGVVAIDPNAVIGPPPVVLEEAWAKKVNLRREIRTPVPAGSDTFDFTFTALSLSAPEKQRFKYRLEPYDKDWVDAGARRTAHYTNMAPGEYSFRVIAASSSGIWNNQGSSVRFVLRPHYYQTSWFRALCAAIFIALLWAAYQLRIHQLQRDYNKLQDVIETIPAMAWTALPNGSNEFVNRRWAEYTGVSAEETSGSGWTAAVHPDDLQPFGEKWHASLSTGQPFESEARFRCAENGEYRWLLARGVPLRDGHGKIIRWYGILTDIEDRRRAEKALSRSEAYLAEAQRLSQTGSWAFDLASDRYEYLSEECFRIFEVNAQERFPSREAIRRLISEEDRDSADESYRRSIREKVDTVSEFRITLPNGTTKHIQAIRHPVLDDAGDVVKLVGTVIDITERKRAERERERLRQLEAELAHLNRVSMMGELAASVAHEVNQPLAGVVSNGSACLRWLAGDLPNLEEAREAARRIIRDGKRAAEVIVRIRTLAKRAEMPKERLDLNETIREVLALIGDRAKRNRVTIRTEFAEDLSPVLGDRVQLQQVVLNLVMNAIEAMSQAEERPRELLITTEDIEDGQVLVTVQDSGTGIDPDVMGKIFDPFYTTKPGGMGMGLRISRTIIETHGGHLWAAANDGPGATFQFSFPKCTRKGSDAEA